MRKQIYKKLLLGLGFDAKDGHVRITKGKNFRLFGGSEETHEMLQEKAVKFNEQLDKKGRNLDDISPDEFFDIIHKIAPELPNDNKKGK